MNQFMPSKGHDVGSWHNNASERTWSKHSSLTGDRRAIHRITVVTGHLNELSVSSQQIQEQKLKLPIELELSFAFSVK
ncbi:hypothetical protein CGMCC3_g14760 [Colletotrichum fructicola]|nr:uncharacterized protein CGMCC3_g14760 [Colletotrichum fructicola]KAE9569182.1 hypothetical protein CGMCC3_g14760 [Colletotrichum fructicola]KAF4421038.1 hypothetical protein CFRS1_v005317 [Colletotrichum fructicola]KAF5495634.1 hypothetical protein CGCF413_v008233 [Colletotrichum fructicola]